MGMARVNVLVLNAGSSSQKCSLFQLDGPGLPGEPREPSWHALLDATAPGQTKDRLQIRISSRNRTGEDSIPSGSTQAERVARMVSNLWEGPCPILTGPKDIDATGHRVVHGGGRYNSAVRIDESVEAVIEQCMAFAPLHNRHNLDGIRTCKGMLGSESLQIAVFDTAFHHSLPAPAATYAGPSDWREQQIRRYGFHGTSFRWASARAAQLLGRIGDPELRLILCHLGGGCSLAATVGGTCIDTTMGFTPLDGIAMCTRSGEVDPGILIYLLRQGESADTLEQMLNKESGLQGLSGMPGDTRIILPEARKGHARAQLAIDVFVHRLRAGIGAMLAALGNLPDAIVFTDAMAEDEPYIRAAACEPFRFLGLTLDPAKNVQSKLDSDLATADSTVRVLLIHSHENWQIARECYDLVKNSCGSTRPDTLG